VATGYERQPFIPSWPGRDRFTGRLLHAADYRNPAPFRGSDVLVVGSGCSGMEIAYDLAAAGAGLVRLSVRTPPSMLLRSVGGLPGDLPALVLLRLPPRVGDSQVRLLQRLVLGDLAPTGFPSQRRDRSRGCDASGSRRRWWTGRWSRGSGTGASRW
jgi:cation diffusion facilitator CzcD-associated flavoprotein CzcO